MYYITEGNIYTLDSDNELMVAPIYVNNTFNPDDFVNVEFDLIDNEEVIECNVIKSILLQSNQ